jgi:hypothetical protein
VSYHVELRSSLQRAWLFNLTADELWSRVLAPWAARTELDVSGRLWDPRQSLVRILEGPRLAGAELAHGQGWNRAERTARDVTRELLRAPAAVVSPTRAGHDLGVRLLAGAGLAAVDWGPVRATLLAGREAGVSAALVMVSAGAGPWLLDAGLALGGLPGRAHLVSAEPGAPARLGGVEVLSPEAVAGRLRRSPGSA